MGLTKSSTGIKVLTLNGNNNKKEDLVIALAGNPNVGKSTVFNALTGMNQHTGNWPGKTVTNAEGYYEYKDSKVKVVDLPGTYSLLSNSEEEEIARDYICFSKPDVVVVICDATSLERNLNLFFQITEITDNVILCINLIDEAKKKGIRINVKKLKDEIKSTVVETSARDGFGITELKEAVLNSNKNREKYLLKYDEDIEKGIVEIENILINSKELLSKDTIKSRVRWLSTRLLENNISIKETIVNKYNISNELIEKIEAVKRPLNIEDRIVETLVKEAEKVNNSVVNINLGYGAFQRKVDKVLVSKKTGIPIMIITLLVVLWITITLANYPSQWLASMFSEGEDLLRSVFNNIAAPDYISGILIDGIYVTLAWVISVMLPPMAIFFPMFTLLEDLGYLPRIAFNLDKCFKKCSACGKQALTMCMGLGCNAAGIIGCRIINSPRERLIAILTNVFMPCNGRFPMLITISSLFIGGMAAGFKSGFLAAFTVTSVIILGVFMTLIISKILSKTVLKGVPSSFILELPPYRKPQIGKVIVRSIFDRTLYVLGRAISVAAPAGIIIWIFSNISVGDGTILSVCADFLTPFANMIGLDGYILMAFILGFPANEIVMPIIIMSYLRASTIMEMDSLVALKELLISNGWTVLTAINTMILCLMHYPCGTTVWTIKKETKSIKWTALSIIIPTVAGIVLCFFTTQIWRLIA